MILAEDLLLLLLNDESGKLRAAGHVGTALGGAVLADLAIAGCVVLPEKTGWRQPKVEVAAPAPQHPLLVEALAVMAEKPRTAQDLVERLGKGLKDRVIAELVACGILAERTDRALGLFPRTRWPAVDSTHEAQVREAIAAALATGQPADPRVGALIGVLSGLGVIGQVIEVPGLSRREVTKQAKRIADGAWAARGVRDAVNASNAAIAAAIAASTAATTTTIT